MEANMFNNRVFNQFGRRALAARRVTVLFLAIALVAFTFSIVTPAQTVHATYPGQNGRIAYGVLDRTNGFFYRYTANPDGSHVQPLTDLPGYLNPTWSPDGTRIALDIIDANGSTQVAITAPDGSDIQVLTSGPFIHEGADWSPDGTQLVFNYSPKDPALPGFSTVLWVMNSDGTNAHPLMTAELSGFDYEPRWQPAGELITFSRIRKYVVGLQQEAVFVVNADGTNPRQLTPWGLAAEHPTWSPDGKLIIFNDASWNPYPIESIWIMKPDGTDRHVLYQGTERTGHVKPWFSPDGTKILFACGGFRPYNGDLCIMNADGTGVVNITNSPGILEGIPSWGTAPLQ